MKKLYKKILILGIGLFSLTIVSCKESGDLVPIDPPINEDDKKFTVIWENYDGELLEADFFVPYGTIPSYDGETPFKQQEGELTYTFSGWSPSIQPVTQDITYRAIFNEKQTPDKTELTYTYKDYYENCLYNTPPMPSIGESKVLVVPVLFTDSTNYISNSNLEKVRNNIELAFFGTNEEVGWYSVKTFYEEESHHLLTLTGEVTDWYKSSYSSSISQNQTNVLVNEVASWFKNQVGQETYESYDTNNDGYIDAMCLIYGAPANANNNSNLWAYTYWLQESNTKNNVIPNTFLWASYDFMNNDTSHGVNIDTHTYIHEMGHILGLDDYYDYNNGNIPAGGFSMQDYNVGGHDPFSMMALGWVKPYVINETISIKINSFEETGDLILLSPEFTGSPFDEYLLLELYTPTGVNYLDSENIYNGYYPSGPSIAGIRLWHVDARMRGAIIENNEAIFVEDKYYTDFKDNNYYYNLSMSNTSYIDGSANNVYACEFEEDRKFDLLALIRNNRENDYNMKNTFNQAAMFMEGDTFSMDEYAPALPNGNKLNNGLDLGFSFEVLDLNEDNATIYIKKA